MKDSTTMNTKSKTPTVTCIGRKIARRIAGLDHAEAFLGAERTEEASALPESPRRQLVEDS